MIRQSMVALVRRLRQEIRVALSLSPLVVAALVLGILLWRGGAETVSGLFQSSPVEPPTATATQMATVTATPSLVESTTPEASPGATETALPPPSEAPTGTSEPTLPAQPTEPLPTDTPAVTDLPPTLAVSPTEAPTLAEEAEAEAPTGERYAEGESRLIFDWGMLLDALALLFSYIWLICGILLFLSVPAYFLVRWLRRRREEQVEE